MAKTKKTIETEAMVEAPVEAPAEETTETKRNGRFLNYLPVKNVHTRTTATGRTFMSVSVPCGDKWYSIAVNKGQILAAKGADSNKFCTVLLGDADKSRKATTAKAEGEGWDEIELTNAQLADEYEAARKASYAAYKAAKQG